MHIDGYNYINDVGYGFYAGRLSGATVFDLAARCDSKVSFCSMAKSILGEEKLPLDLTAEDRKKMCDGITRWLEENECSVAEYVATLINYEECIKGHISRECMVYPHGSFVVFPCIMFPDDRTERTKYIKSRADFQKMIKEYLPDEDLIFGTVHDGNTKSSHEYWLGT